MSQRNWKNKIPARARNLAWMMGDPDNWVTGMIPVLGERILIGGHDWIELLDGRYCEIIDEDKDYILALTPGKKKKNRFREIPYHKIFIKDSR